MTNVLDIRELRKTYGDTTAVDGISFAVGRNELVGYQASKRGGTVGVKVVGERVLLFGEAVTVIRGSID